MELTDLGVLARDFDFINFIVLKFRQVMANKRKRLDTRTRVEHSFIFVPPLLQPTNVLIVIRFRDQEVFLKLFLYVLEKGNSSRTTFYLPSQDLQ
jgi:hypothetical protein